MSTFSHSLKGRPRPAAIVTGEKDSLEAASAQAPNWMTTPKFWEMYWFLLQLTCAAALAVASVAVLAVVPVVLIALLIGNPQ